MHDDGASVQPVSVASSVIAAETSGIDLLTIPATPKIFYVRPYATNERSAQHW